MTNLHLRDSLYWQLFRVAIAAKHNLMTIAETYDLTVMQLYTLSLLEADQSIPMNSLSSLLYCDASNVTGIVDRLLHQEYIKREENPKDRREKIITLTPKGVAVCEKVSQTLLSHEPAGFQAFSKEQREEFHALISRALQSPISSK